MEVTHDHFSDESVALAEIEAAGYNPMTVDFPAETGETCVCGVGARLQAPHGVLHREQTKGYKALIGLSIMPEEITQPINKEPPVTIAQ
jgi:hypothetical protein